MYDIIFHQYFKFFQVHEISERCKYLGVEFLPHPAASIVLRNIACISLPLEDVTKMDLIQQISKVNENDITELSLMDQDIDDDVYLGEQKTFSLIPNCRHYENTIWICIKETSLPFKWLKASSRAFFSGILKKDVK